MWWIQFVHVAWRLWSYNDQYTRKLSKTSGDKALRKKNNARFSLPDKDNQCCWLIAECLIEREEIFVTYGLVIDCRKLDLISLPVCKPRALHRPLKAGWSNISVLIGSLFKYISSKTPETSRFVLLQPFLYGLCIESTVPLPQQHASNTSLDWKISERICACCHVC